MAQLPTHIIKDKDGHEVELHLSTAITKGLKDSDPKVRKAARDFVCTAYRRACIQQFPDDFGATAPKVPWSHLDIEQLV